MFPRPALKANHLSESYSSVQPPMYMVGKGLAGGVHALELELRTRKKKYGEIGKRTLNYFYLA